jgi:hypothetical protein
LCTGVFGAAPLRGVPQQQAHCNHPKQGKQCNDSGGYT